MIIILIKEINDKIINEVAELIVLWLADWNFAVNKLNISWCKWAPSGFSGLLPTKTLLKKLKDTSATG